MYTVVGLFDNRAQAQAAALELTQRGFIRENIDVSHRRISNDPAAAGAAPISTQVTITESGISDRIGNFFSSLFGDDNKTAGAYTRAAGDADAILSIQVDTEERARQAAEILDRHGALDVEAQSSKYNHLGGQQNFAQPAASSTALPPTAAATVAGATQTTDGARPNETTIPIIEEDLQVGKQEIERGAARIRSRIIEKPVEAHLRLREEHVVINRRPVDREVTNADLTSFQDGEIVLTEHAEIPVVGKQARVVEEVVIEKQVEEHDQMVLETVRRTEVEVEKFEEKFDDRFDDDVDTVVRNIGGDDEVINRRGNSGGGTNG